MVPATGKPLAASWLDLRTPRIDNGARIERGDDCGPANRPAGALANGFDGAGHIAAEADRERERHEVLQIAAARLDVYRINGSASDSHANLTPAWLRHRNGFHAKEIRTSVALQHGRLHRIGGTLAGDAPRRCSWALASRQHRLANVLRDG